MSASPAQRAWAASETDMIEASWPLPVVAPVVIIATRGQHTILLGLGIRLALERRN
jgi:hypothetical protein